MTTILSKAQQDHNALLAQNPTKIGHYVRMINPSELDQLKRQQLWAGIKRKNPALADCLKNDPNIAKLKEMFAASIVFTEAEIENYLND